MVLAAMAMLVLTLGAALVMVLGGGFAAQPEAGTPVRTNEGPAEPKLDGALV